MHKFHHIALAIRLARRAKNISQDELASKVGYKNGQIISNVERGIASIPERQIQVFSDVLGISVESLVEAMGKDYTDRLKWRIPKVVEREIA